MEKGGKRLGDDAVGVGADGEEEQQAAHPGEVGLRRAAQQLRRLPAQVRGFPGG